jgi:hypothetical protein
MENRNYTVEQSGASKQEHVPAMCQCALRAGDLQSPRAVGLNNGPNYLASPNKPQVRDYNAFTNFALSNPTSIKTEENVAELPRFEKFSDVRILMFRFVLVKLSVHRPRKVAKQRLYGREIMGGDVAWQRLAYCWGLSCPSVGSFSLSFSPPIKLYFSSSALCSRTN